MRATFFALEPEENRYRFPSVRPHGGLLQSCFLRAGHARDRAVAGKARSYSKTSSYIQDVSFLSREPFPAPSNIRASEQAISNRAH